MAEKKVEIKITADAAQAVVGVGQVGAALDQVAGKEGGVANAAAQSAEKQTSSHKRIRDGVDSISTQLDSLKGQLLGLVGIGIGTQGVKDLTALADGYKNLEARIKLVTGEGKAFDTAFQGVFDVAMRTNSAVEETGLLFTKLYEAGKPLGLLQKDALNLTETINQSIQLSGASAEASKASITQLIQGLQSGVLRGDEFNSVMEQSPRLAKALADGLGVTTGELRKLAEAGQLTSTAVISSLQKQSDAIADEFGKLPATVGRAMTNLTTEFTRYVGEADKAGGYTSKLATVVDALASNLSTVATVMIHTGQAVGAMKLLSMAQQWLSASAAIKGTAAATEAAVVSTVKSTVATVANTAATTANTAAHNANSGALSGSGKAAAVAETQVSAFGAAMKLLKGFVLLDIAFNFKSYGTAIGEAAAKLMGYKDRTEELTRADKLANEIAQQNIKSRRDYAAALKEAADRSFDLSKAGTEMVAKFDEMRVKGESAADAIAKIGKDFDLASVPGIKDAINVLDKLKEDGKLTAQEFRKAWSDALSGQDLAAFEVKAKAVFLQVQDAAEKAAEKWREAIARGVEGKELEALKKKAEDAFAATTRESEKLAQMLDATLREAIKRTGLDFDLISGGMSKASQSAINDTEAMIKGLERLKEMGVDTGQALAASLSRGINTADSEKALAAVLSQIEAVRKALGDKVADGLLDQAKQKSIELGDALDKAKPGINSLREAMRELGVTSDQTFKDTAEKSKAAYDAMLASGRTSTRELSDGFKKAAEDAIAANKGVAPAWVNAQAAARGYTVEADAAGKATLRASADGKQALSALGDQWKMTAEQIKSNEEAIDRLMMKYTLSADYTERQLTLLEKENALLERREALEDKRLNRDKEGFSVDPKTGQRVNMAVDTQASTYERAKSQGLSEEQALQIMERFINERGEKKSFGDGGYFGALQGQTWASELQKAINELKVENARNAVANQKNQQNPQPTEAPQAQPREQVPPAQRDDAAQRGGSSAMGVNLTINVAAGADLGSRAQIDQLARQLMPAIESLRSKGVR